MAICKDCLHFEICSPYTAPNESYPEVEGGCRCYKDKAKSIDFPCKLGDTVYWADKSIPLKSHILTGKVFALGIDEHFKIWVSVRYTNGLTFYHPQSDFKKILYFTRKEAKKALAEKEA